jgi:hypothetical protein
VVSILKRLHKFLYSIKLTLYLFFILAVTSIVGSVTTRTNLVAPPEDITLLGKIFKTYDIFHSWWFIVIVVLFSINLTLCIIHRFVPQVKKYFSKERFNEKAVKSPWISDKIKLDTSAPLDTGLDNVKQFLKKKGYKVHVTEKGIVGEKGRYSRLLPFLFHISLLIIIIGSLIGAIFGFVGTVNVHVKTETNEFYNWTDLKNDKFDFVMRLDDFYLEYYPVPVTIAVKDTRTIGKVDLYDVKDRDTFQIKGSPYKVLLMDAMLDKQFTASDFFFKLLKDDKIIGDFYDDQEIEDFPYDLYYPVQLRVGVRQKSTGVNLSLHTVSVGESFNIPDSPYEVLINGFGKMSEEEDFSFHYALYKNGEKVGEYYGHDAVPGFPYVFVMNAYRLPVFEERIPKFMTATLQIKKDGEIKQEGKIEVNHPMTYDGITFYETSFGRDSFGFMYVGLQMVNDPGISIVYAGFILMFIAVTPIFLVSHKKVYITHDQDYIYLTGEATKNKKDFKEEFFHYAKELRDHA